MACKSFEGVELELCPLLQNQVWLSYKNSFIFPLLLLLWLETNVWDDMACKSLKSAEFGLLPLLQGQFGHHTKRLLYLPYYWFQGF